MDFRGLFLDNYIGWPGKVDDARVFFQIQLSTGREEKGPCYLLGKGESMELRYAI